MVSTGIVTLFCCNFCLTLKILSENNAIFDIYEKYYYNKKYDSLYIYTYIVMPFEIP